MIYIIQNAVVGHVSRVVKKAGFKLYMNFSAVFFIQVAYHDEIFQGDCPNVCIFITISGSCCCSGVEPASC